MYSHVACDVMKERTLYLLKPSSLIWWHLMPYLFLFHFAFGWFCVNSLFASGVFCHLVIILTFSNSLGPDQDRQTIHRERYENRELLIKENYQSAKLFKPFDTLIVFGLPERNF